MTIVQNADKSFSDIPAFDPVASANTLVQDVAQIELKRTNDHAAIDTTYDAEIALLKTLYGDIVAAAALDANIAATVDPILSAGATQYPRAAGILTS